MKIHLSLLSSSPFHLRENLEAFKNAGGKTLHIDIMDGHFVPNLSFGTELIRWIKSDFPDFVIDLHLMVNHVDGFLDFFPQADQISIHPEATFHPYRTLQKIRGLGKKAGLALNPGTPLEVISPLKDTLDFILLMSVNPGFGGQEFLSSSYERALRAKELFNKPIYIDGGINNQNISLLKDKVDKIIIGGYLFDRGILNSKKLKECSLA